MSTMLLALAAAVTTAIAAPASQPANSTPFSDGLPPSRYRSQADITTLLEVTNQPGIDKACSALFTPPPPGMKTNACFTGQKIIMPNPCDFPNETYAKLLCHEMGHVNGWPSTHGD
ncbi:MAG: hypothetical protein ACXW3D_08730 [Caulobacteraceae bacterium]